MSLESIRDRLRGVRGKALIPEALGEEAVELAADLLKLARRKMRFADRRQGRRMARLMEDPRGKAMTLLLADQVFRSHAARRSANQFRHLIRDHGVPHYLPFWERGMMAAGGAASLLAPSLVVPMISRKMRAESRSVILPSEEGPLGEYMESRRRRGVEINLNQLGEAVLGEEEAARRLDAVIGRLRSSRVDYISVKLSAIYSQINLVAFEASLEEVKERLRAIYRAAQTHPYIDAGGRAHRKFVNLDMEEYRDLHLTTEAFKAVLDEPEFVDLEAGIVLQAYLPDSAQVQADLTAWALVRQARGGAGIKVRIVKGANLAMEQVEASLHGWEQAPYDNKVDVDANYKKMVDFACRADHAAAVRVGIASHNLFDVAYGMLAAEMYGTAERVEFEMLEGMANHQVAALKEAASDILVYAPVARRDNFHSALAYLIRRLDENTSEENFLRNLFPMKPGSAEWQSEKGRFLDACARVLTVSSEPRRVQDRGSEEIVADPAGQPFANAPDTDWSLPANRRWISAALDRWRDGEPEFVPLQIDGDERDGAAEAEVFDRSCPGRVAYRHALAGEADVDEALRVAARAFQTWSLKPDEERARVLREVAAVIAQGRDEAIGCMVLDGAKAVAEADVEVSEATDFANYYARAFEAEGLADCVPKGRGVVVVAPPWNFPYAIPASGVLAAVMAGNAVILKPAPQAVLSSSLLAKQLWEAGVPKDVLQFLPCPDDEVGKALITDRRVDTVVLTGAYDTGDMFRGWKPDIRLMAETSGKNAMVITAAADPEQAAKDLARSAFGHAGQKCSAASLALVEKEVYERIDFRRQLRDAAQSLKVGPAWDTKSVVTPLVDPPGRDLTRALTQLDEGEEWLLEPRQVGDNPHLWSPGIKLGVRPDGEFFKAECFGPVLGLVCVKNLAEAIALQNSGDFGLTGGIQSLDSREIAEWGAKVEVGNAYINRPITGAIVRRQPFGGWGHSVFGPGAKAGGPDYVLAFADWEQVALPEQRETPGDVASKFLGEVRKRLISPEDRERLGVAGWNYGWAFRKIFCAEHDPSGLLGERNVLRYRPHRRMLFRASGGSELERTCTLAALATAVTGIPLDLSVPGGEPSEDLDACERIPGLRLVREGESEFARRLRHLGDDELPSVIRAPGGAPLEVYEFANRIHAPVITDPILANGRLELRHWFKEQAVSETTHRYGNVLPRFREST